MATNQEIADLTPFYDGGKEVFSNLFKIYYPKLVTYYLRRGLSLHDAQDLASECFRKIVQSNPTFENFTGAVKYLYTVAQTSIIDFNTRNIRGAPVFPEDLPEMVDPDSEAFFDAIERNTVIEALRKAIAGLPEQAQKVMRLRIEEGLKRSDIAELLGISPSTVSAHIQVSTKKIRMMLKSMGYNAFIVTCWICVLLR